jgi:hypothetical protein
VDNQAFILTAEGAEIAEKKIALMIKKVILNIF